MSKISDYFPYYPDIKDDSFFLDLTRKKEFLELELSPSEPIPQRGKLFKHQESTVRYLTHYTRLLCLHEPGTGKSCIISAISEILKKQYEEDIHEQTSINKVIILVRNKQLIDNMMNEISKCISNYSMKQKKNRYKEIKQWYKVYTYKQFENIVKNIPPSQYKRAFTKSAILIDEAHNLIVKKSETKRPESKKRSVKRSSDDKVESFDTYINILKVIDEGVQLVSLFTAIPMINSSKEIVPLINMINEPKDRLKDSDVQDGMTVEQLLKILSPKIRGKVSYVKTLDTGVEQVFEGESIVYKDITNTTESLISIPDTKVERTYKTIVENLEMSDTQSLAYYNALQTSKKIQNTNGEDNDASDDVIEDDSNFYGENRQISNMYFPDPNSTKQYNINTLIKDNQLNKSDAYYLNVLNPIISNMDNLKEYSAKFHRIIEICEENYRETDRTKKGLVYIYFPDFVKGAGVVVLSEILNKFGFNKYTAADEMMPNAKRFAIISSGITETDFNSIIRMTQNPENMFGDKISVIVVSRIGQEGFSLFNVSKVIITSPSWNYSRYIQSLNRAFRSTSHSQKIQKLRQEGLLDPKERLPVSVFNLCSVYNKNFVKRYSDIDRYNETINSRMYILAEIKNSNISRVMLVCKMNSFDSYINRKRNMRGIDGSHDCNFGPCKYDIPVKTKDIIYTDYKSKLIYYSEDDQNRVKDLVVDMFKYRSIFTFGEILETVIITTSNINMGSTDIRIPSGLIAQSTTRKTDRIISKDLYNRLYTLISLSKIINSKEILKDQFGFDCYLKSAGEMTFYLEKVSYFNDDHTETAINSQYNIIYSNMLIANNNPDVNTFENFLLRTQTEIGEKQIQIILELPDNVPDSVLDSKLASLSLTSIVKIVEYIIEQILENPHINHEYGTWGRILEKYKHNIFKMYDYNDSVIELNNQLKRQQIVRRRGRPSTSDKIDITANEVKRYSTTNYVVVHMLKGTTNKTSYTETEEIKRGKVPKRMFRLGKWLDMSETEDKIYSYLISEKTEYITELFRKTYGLYGEILSPSFKFKIIEDRDIKSKSEKSRGKECSHWTSDELKKIILPFSENMTKYVYTTISILSNRSTEEEINTVLIELNRIYKLKMYTIGNNINGSLYHLSSTIKYLYDDLDYEISRYNPKNISKIKNLIDNMYNFYQRYVAISNNMEYTILNMETIYCKYFKGVIDSLTSTEICARLEEYMRDNQMVFFGTFMDLTVDMSQVNTIEEYHDIDSIPIIDIIRELADMTPVKSEESSITRNITKPPLAYDDEEISEFSPINDSNSFFIDEDYQYEF